MNWHEQLGPVPTLEERYVHVWRISTAMLPAKVERLTEILTPDERSRAASFHFERDRRAFSVCRAVLRLLLECYADYDAPRIRFRYGPQGKPALVDPRFPELRFNVSHSGDQALLAFAFGRDVGVDVELMRPGLEFTALAETSFSKDERVALLAHPPASRASLFYQYWTCKEACIKADGRGLAVSLDGFSVVTVSRDPHWRTVSLVTPTALASGMRVRILSVGNGYAAAVAAVGADWEVRQIELSRTPQAEALSAANNESNLIRDIH
jgi:4'-phosphopantetheinyl transferase